MVVMLMIMGGGDDGDAGDMFTHVAADAAV